MAKNFIFSGKPPRNPISYEQWWENYLAGKPEREEAARKRSARAKIQYANRLANADKDVMYKGRTYSPEANRMRYLMEQLDKGERERLRRGIYDDSKTQSEIAEKIIEEGEYDEEEVEAIKKKAMDIYYEENRQQARRRGRPKPPKPDSYI